MFAFLVDNFALLISQNQLAVYLLAYLSIIFLGNIGAFVGFWLALSGVLGGWGIVLMITIALLADITADFFWYSIGRFLRDTRFGIFIKNHLPYHRTVEAGFQKRYRRWIFLAKFVFFSNFAVIFLAGWAKIKFSELFKISLLALLIWEPLLLFLTYVLTSSLTPLSAVSIFKKIEYLLSAGIVAFLVFYYPISYLLGYFLRKFLIDEKANEKE